MVKFGPNNIQVILVNVFFDESTNTKINETTTLLQYESQNFKCQVKLRILPGEADSCWSVGLVQACDQMYLENRYGDIGSSFWEFHPLKSGRYVMLNDSDGLQYPFYCSNNSKMEISCGNVDESAQCLGFEDHFYPTVVWELPYCQNARLTDVIRRQSFWIWLVAIRRGDKIIGGYNYFNPRCDEVFILRTMRWKYNLHMTFDKDKPVGQKLINVINMQDEYPLVLNYCKTLPLSALAPPNCNAAQSLIWYPSDINEQLKVLVPPTQIITPWEVWQNEMSHNRTLKVHKSKHCKFVGEWPLNNQKLKHFSNDAITINGDV